MLKEEFAEYALSRVFAVVTFQRAVPSIGKELLKDASGSYSRVLNPPTNSRGSAPHVASVQLLDAGLSYDDCCVPRVPIWKGPRTSHVLLKENSGLCSSGGVVEQ